MLAGAVFEVQRNTSNMTVQFKMNVERCSEYKERKFKGDTAGAAAVIKLKTTPTILEPTKPVKGSS
jgi:hypothetical protein